MESFLVNRPNVLQRQLSQVFITVSYTFSNNINIAQRKFLQIIAISKCCFTNGLCVLDDSFFQLTAVAKSSVSNIAVNIDINDLYLALILLHHRVGDIYLATDGKGARILIEINRIFRCFIIPIIRKIRRITLGLCADLLFRSCSFRSLRSLR